MTKRKRNVMFGVILLILSGTFAVYRLVVQDAFMKGLPERLNFYENDALENTEELEQFLAAPLDLQHVKRKKSQGSNSGSSSNNEHFFRPPYQGFYYRYFLFQGFGEHGPSLITYKRGTQIGGYLDKDEVLIQLQSDRPDPDLGAANLVGENIRDILERFGGNFLKKERVIAYQNSQGRVLLLHVYESHISRFTFIRLQHSIVNLSDLSKCSEKNNLEHFFRKIVLLDNRWHVTLFAKSPTLVVVKRLRTFNWQGTQ